MTEEKFNKLTIQKKYELLKNKGDFIASRFYQTYRIHLYKYSDVLAEVWVKLGLNQIYWIETVDKDRIDLYADEINIKFNL